MEVDGGKSRSVGEVGGGSMGQGGAGWGGNGRKGELPCPTRRREQLREPVAVTPSL